MTILEMSAGGALLIAVILLLRRLALHHLPKWTFLLLWAVALFRLLAPFSLPSQFSVYTGAARVAQLLEQDKASEPSESQTPVVLPPATVPGAFREDVWVMPAVPDIPAPTPEKVTVSPLAAVYLTGAVLCGLFFLTVYGRCMHRFHEAEPIKSDFLDRWQEEHHTLFPVKVKTCGAVSAPMAYGLLRPVILLPMDTVWSNEDQLVCILTHEYVHIRRGDLFWKLLLTAAVCVHWFNPLVWAMYFCSNRDLELACDEAVVRILGLDSRKGYAYTLLFAAESGFSPFCTTYTTKNHMEERIRAIMKMKKRSAAAVLAAVVLVSGITAVFATSQVPTPEDLEKLPHAVMSNSTPKPSATTPGEKNKPAVSGRIHPVTGAPNQSAPEQQPAPAVEPTTEPVTEPTTEPVTALVLENRWGVPNIDPLPLGLVIPAESEEDMHDLIDYLCQSRGLTIFDITHGHNTYGNGIEEWAVTISYEWSTQPGGRPPEDGKDYYNWPASDVSSVVDRWNVPVGPIPAMTEIQAGTMKDAAELRQYLMQVRGIRAGDMAGGSNSSGTHFILITYEQTDREGRLANGYPVNSKGETYGCSGDLNFIGDFPDLIAVKATNGVSGYAVKKELDYGDYQGPDPRESVENMTAFMEWQKTQPSSRMVKVYDVNRDNIVGYLPVGDGRASMTQEEELEMIANQMRKWGNSEEQIAADLEYYKQTRGWN